MVIKVGCWAAVGKDGARGVLAWYAAVGEAAENARYQQGKTDARCRWAPPARRLVAAKGKGPLCGSFWAAASKPLRP